MDHEKCFPITSLFIRVRFAHKHWTRLVVGPEVISHKITDFFAATLKDSTDLRVV